jgi:hypothetical protein
MQLGSSADAAPADMQQQPAPPLCLAAHFPNRGYLAAELPAASVPA